MEVRIKGSTQPPPIKTLIGFCRTALTPTQTGASSIFHQSDHESVLLVGLKSKLNLSSNNNMYSEDMKKTTS